MSGITIATEADRRTSDEKRRADILRRFERVPQTSDSIRAIEASTAAFRQDAERILAATTPGREQSGALTALEEAKFWTNQSLALNGALVSPESEEAQAEAIRESLKKVPQGSTFSLTDEAAELLKQSDARREQAAE